MSLLRIKKPGTIQSPATRVCRLRRKRRFALEALESRRPLSAGLYSSTADLPPDSVSRNSSMATVLPQPTAIDRQSNAASAKANGPRSSGSGTPGSPGGGDAPTADPDQAPSQGGAGGGTNGPPQASYVSGPPASPSPGVQDDFNPGLLDPLAWTLSDDQLSSGVTDAFDAEDSIIVVPGSPAVPGQSTQMGRPDDPAIASAPDRAPLRSGGAMSSRHHFRAVTSPLHSKRRRARALATTRSSRVRLP